jgi:hypothetical protein
MRNTNNKKIKVCHLLTKPTEEREIKSVKDITKLCNSNDKLDYYQNINKPYEENPPNDNVIFGNSHWVVGKTKPRYSFGLISGHYGCYLAHINAINDFFSDDNKTYDYLLLVECDCKIEVEYFDFQKKLDEACSILDRTNYKLFSFVYPNHQSQFYEDLDNNIYATNLIICTHMYLINKKHKDFYERIIKDYGWHCMDWWYNMVFEQENEKFLCFKGSNLTSQFEGDSQIDRI